jgi:hypothetical protein
MARASLAIGVDTGLAHLAAALRVPVIALYVATDPGADRRLWQRLRAQSRRRGAPPVGRRGADGCRAGAALMARLLYSLLFYLAMPLVWLRLLWRARRQPEYLQHLGERHGLLRAAPDGR